MEILVIAGPNGAGKSTAAAGYLPPSATFINADDIARIEGVSEITAGRISVASMTWRLTEQISPSRPR